MAGFTEETHLYEILIRVSDTGLWTAQYQNLNVVKKDGAVISATVSDVAPLTPDDAAAFEVVTQLVGEASARNMTMVPQLQELVSEQAELIIELRGKLAEAQNEMEALRAASTVLAIAAPQITT